MAANYPTYSTDMGMNNRAMSNNLRTAGQRQQHRSNPYGNTFNRAATQPTYSQPQYSSNQARGGSQPQQRPMTYNPAPLPGQGPVDREGGNTYYNPTMPTYTPTRQPGQVQANTFSYYPGLDPTTLQSNDEREAALQSVQANVPIWQLNQNAYQYAQDANEATRRWQEQFNYQQGLDQFNMGQSTRQQQMAEWQAQQAASQWAADYNRQTGNDQWQQNFSQQQFGLQDYQTREQLRQQQGAQDWLRQYQQGQLDTTNRELGIRDTYQQGQLNMGNRELDIRNQYQQGQLQQGNRQLDIQQQLNLGNLDVQRQQNAITEAYNQGRLSNEQRQIALAELTQQQNFHIQNAQNDVAFGRLNVERGQLEVQQRANDIDNMYKSGQLSLGQRNAALAELTQSQTYGMQQAQLAQLQAEQGRRFGLDERTQMALEVFRQQQLAQEAQLAQQQLAAQREQALLAATGRNQRANVRWMRNT